MGLLHAICLRDVLREVPFSDPPAVAQRWDERTMETVEPLYRDTLAFDRHRLAEIDAQIAGRPYETDDPGWLFSKALGALARTDPDALRARAAVNALLVRGVDLLADRVLVDRVLSAGPADPLPGPTRDELLNTIRQHSP
jgi:hypothetical protein